MEFFYSNAQRFPSHLFRDKRDTRARMFVMNYSNVVTHSAVGRPRKSPSVVFAVNKTQTAIPFTDARHS